MIATTHLNQLRLAGYRARTIHSRKIVLTAFEKSLPGRRITEATRYDVEAWLARDLKPATRRSYQNHLRAFFLWAIEEGLMAVDPTAKLKSVRVPRNLPRPIEGDKLQSALDRSDQRMRAWLLLMALAGLRCMEVAGLRPCDVVEGSEGDGPLLFLRECKGGGSDSVPAHPLIMEALALLPIRNGLWWDVNGHTVSTNVAEFMHSIGITETAHSLRHYAGTKWFKASGHDLLTTARLLRHASVQTTTIYAKLDPTRPAEVVNAVSIGRVA